MAKSVFIVKSITIFNSTTVWITFCPTFCEVYYWNEWKEKDLWKFPGGRRSIFELQNSGVADARNKQVHDCLQNIETYICIWGNLFIGTSIMTSISVNRVIFTKYFNHQIIEGTIPHWYWTQLHLSKFCGKMLWANFLRIDLLFSN